MSTTLAKTLYQHLKDKEMLLTTAESCTGGMIATYITDIAGSSKIFDRGFVTYSNDAKQDMLGVSSDTINTHGAVSSPCANDMALGALSNSKASIAVSVTGIAGPDGGSTGKPVGLVYIGVCIRGKEAEITRCHFSGDRKNIRQQTSDKALRLLIDCLVTV